jgi:hypothetical protein
MKGLSYGTGIAVVVDEVAGDDAAAGIAGANELSAAPTVGGTFVIGTAGAELTPRLPIS